MPSSVKELFKSAGLEVKGPVRFGDMVPEARAGVYVLSRTLDPSLTCIDTPAGPLISLKLLRSWISKVQELLLDGERPTPRQLANRLRSFWLPEEPVIYIGETDNSLGKRLGKFRRHVLGNPSPHHGGHWVKTLSDLDEMSVFWSPVDGTVRPRDVERHMLHHFVANVSESTRSQLCDPERPFPWANLRVSGMGTKQDGIRNPVNR